MQMKLDYRAAMNKVSVALTCNNQIPLFCSNWRENIFVSQSETQHEDTVLGWLTDRTPPPSIFLSPSLSFAPWLICALLPTSPPLDPIVRPCPHVSAVHRQEVMMIYVLVCVFLLCISFLCIKSDHQVFSRACAQLRFYCSALLEKVMD